MSIRLDVSSSRPHPTMEPKMRTPSEVNTGTGESSQSGHTEPNTRTMLLAKATTASTSSSLTLVAGVLLIAFATQLVLADPPPEFPFDIVLHHEGKSGLVTLNTFIPVHPYLSLAMLQSVQCPVIEAN